MKECSYSTVVNQLQDRDKQSTRNLKKNQFLLSLYITIIFKIPRTPSWSLLRQSQCWVWKQAVKLEGGYRSPMAMSSQLVQQDGGTLALQNKWVGFWSYKSTLVWIKPSHLSFEIFSPAWVKFHSQQCNTMFYKFKPMIIINYTLFMISKNIYHCHRD